MPLVGITTSGAWNPRVLQGSFSTAFGLSILGPVLSQTLSTALLQGSVCSGGRSPPRREAFAAYAGQLPNEKAGNSVPIELRRLCYDSGLVGFEEPGTVCGGSLAGSSWPTRELLAHCSPYAGRVDFLGG